MIKLNTDDAEVDDTKKVSLDPTIEYIQIQS